MSMSENTAIVASKTAAYAGSGAAVISGLTLNEIGVIVGIFVGVIGLIASQYWSWRKDQREHLETQLRLRKEYGSQFEEL